MRIASEKYNLQWPLASKYYTRWCSKHYDSECLKSKCLQQTNGVQSWHTLKEITSIIWVRNKMLICLSLDSVSRHMMKKLKVLKNSTWIMPKRPLRYLMKRDRLPPDRGLLSRDSIGKYVRRAYRRCATTPRDRSGRDCRAGRPSGPRRTTDIRPANPATGRRRWPAPPTRRSFCTAAATAPATGDLAPRELTKRQYRRSKSDCLP